MHEFGIADALLQAALEVTEAHGARPIAQVRVHIGRLRQVLPEALTFAFNALTVGTLAQDATLVWEEIPPRVCCSACHTVFQPQDDWFWTCPRCDAAGGEVLEGNELLLESVLLKP